mgnify:CR=1 FL=1
MNWNALKELRQIFLDGSKKNRNYWDSKELLEAYDETFAKRIGWKWDSVLNEIKPKLHIKAGFTLVDWGAGTGIATRRFLSHFEDSVPEKIILVERSEAAREFAKSKIQLESQIPVETSPQIKDLPSSTVLLVSHVLTELSDPAIEELSQLAAQASEVIWIEPGTPECSQHLARVRQKLLPHLQVVAPCTHDSPCPLLDAHQDWCHHFTAVPSEAFTTEKWKTFSKEMGIDLRSLPTSYLVLSKNFSLEREKPLERLIGRSRVYKGYALADFCGPKGITHAKIFEKTDKKLIRFLKDAPFSYLRDATK